MIDDAIHARTVEMLIHSMPYHAILKDAKNGKCLDINSAHLAVYGLQKPEEVMGYTVWDMNNVMNKFWLDNARQVEMFDTEVLHTKKPLIKPMRVWLNSRGQVWAHYMSKIPIVNSKNKVIAILGTSQDLTHTLTLEQLYKYYCSFYLQNAIPMFLAHINLLDYFEKLPTHAEIMVLINKKDLLSNKVIAEQLSITEGTVESHISKIMRKLNSTPTSLKDFFHGINIPR